MVTREPCGDDREAAVIVRQRIDIALPPGDVRDAFVRGQLAGPVEHRRGHVDPGRFANMRGEGADDETRAAGHVQQAVARTRPGGLDDHPQRLLVGDGRGGAEHRRLAGELVEDQILVVRIGHSRSHR